jgi:branched-chain amino acid aminotransferase
MTQLNNSRLAWFNGMFMPENEVLLSFRDRSWKYGDGAFDMTRTFNGHAFRLKEHIDRFYRTLRYLRLDPCISPQEMIDVSEQIVARNEHLRSKAGDWWIGQRVSRGVDPIDDEVPEHSGPNVIVECTPLPLSVDARAASYRTGHAESARENAQLSEHDHRGTIGESTRPRWLGGATRCKRKSR